MEKLADQYDVVIVGAGPTGVTAANYLGMKGVKTLLVDREKDILRIPRAIGLCDEGSRVWQGIGLMDELAKGLPVLQEGKMTAKATGTFMCVNLSEKLNGHPRLRTIKQPDIEAKLRAGLKRFSNVTLSTSTELVDFIDKGSYVNVDLIRGGKKTTVKCNFLLGSDGARSPIREQLGIQMHGKTYGEDWLVIDVFNDPKPDLVAEFSCDHDRPGITIPAPDGGRRWEFKLQEGETHEEVLDYDYLKGLLAYWGDLDEMGLERKAVYTFNARVAEKFHEGNVFLMGDAAHLTPPFAGQGLMAALRDVNNLCWKIAMVINGKADKRLLDSYEEERRKNVENMIKLATTIGTFVMPPNKVANVARDVFVSFMNLVPFFSKSMSHVSTIKPSNNFKSGFVLDGKKVGGIKPGDWCSQGVMLCENNERHMSDDVFGPQWAIVGLGVDPLQYLYASQDKDWASFGGGIFQVEPKGCTTAKHPTSTPRLLDLDGIFESLQGKELCMILRPDRHIACISTTQELGKNLDVLLQNTSNHMLREEKKRA